MSNSSTPDAGATLAQLSQAERILATVDRADDALKLANMAEAARVWARRNNEANPVVNYATSIKARALKRMAECVDAGQAAGEIATAKDGLAIAGLVTPGNELPATLDSLGIDRVVLHRARKLAPLTESDIVAAIDEANAADHIIGMAELIHERKTEERVAREAARAAVEPAADAPTIAAADARIWLPGRTCDLLLTDPPYSTDVDDVAAFAASWFQVALECVKPTGRAFVFIGAYPDELRAYLPLLKRDGWGEQVLAWHYPDTLGPSPTHAFKSVWQAVLYTWGPEASPLNGETLTERTTLQQFNMNSGIDGGRQHQWQKPDRLAERIIALGSAEGATVMDPFCGTGTFLLAAQRLGRQASGCEMDPAMREIAVRRGCRHE